MRIAKVSSKTGDKTGAIAVSSSESEMWNVIAKEQIPQARSVRAIIQSGLVRELEAAQGTMVHASELAFHAPIEGPEKVICIGKNYADHALEMGGTPPEIPVVFNKFPSAIIGDLENIELPAISEAVDFEAELVVVMGHAGKNIARQNAMEHVFGYTIGNDISARDWQKGRPGGQWLLGKTFDTFAPIGPWIVTADELENPHELDIRLHLNGQIMQESNTRHLIFPIDRLVSHLSQFCTLLPGDLIFTGTPAGVGAGRTPPVFLKHGDRLEVTISGLGKLSNPVASNSFDG